MNTGITRNSIGLAAAVLLATAFAAPPVAAQDDLADRVHELEQELKLLRRQLEAQVQGSMDAATAATQAAKEAAAAANEAATADDGPGFEMKGPAPTFSSADGRHTLAVTGRVHWDVGFYDESATDESLNDGSNLRRARLGVKGRIMKDWGYEIVVDGGDSAADDVDIDTAFVSYKGLERLTLTLGQHKAPLSFEDRTSSNDIPFIERSLGTNLFVGQAGGKRFGVSAMGNGDDWWAGAGVFGEKLGVDDGNRVSEQWSLAGRLAFAPHNEAHRGVHLGASGWLVPDPPKRYDDEAKPAECRFRDRPEFRVDDSRWIDARGKDVDSCHGIGAELAAWHKPFWVAAEYTRFGFDLASGDGGTSDYGFDAWYLQAGWVVTGEGRPYSMRNAVWSGVKPADPLDAGGGTGALEVVARYSHADLNDRDIVGGEETNYTVGLNWWLNDWVALKLNYIAVSVEKGGNADEFNAFGLRTQVKW